jgi:hypothetical protein
MNFREIFKWDAYSDQPHVIRDKTVRRAIKKGLLFPTLKLLAVNVVMFPLSLVLFLLLFFKKSAGSVPKNFFAMSINLDKNPESTKALIQELGLKTVLIRLPLSDMRNFQEYKAFIAEYEGYDILINILQDREHVEDLVLLREDLHVIFKELLPFTCKFQIGNAINRKKWAFFSMDEYLRFYEVAQQLKDEEFSQLTLIGSSVIDFEYHYTLRTLFNDYNVHYDLFSSLLYVDRRGAPENTQMGLNLTNKIRLLYAMLLISRKTEPKLVITEANWPRSHTAPYAPTSEKECVSDAEYAAFMVRYYLEALATTQVESIYWHQLIAVGYGLVDNRDGITKYRSFDAYRQMVSLIDGATDITLEHEGGHYTFTCKNRGLRITALWSLTQFNTSTNGADIYSLYGERIVADEIVVGGEVLYFTFKDSK